MLNDIINVTAVLDGITVALVGDGSSSPTADAPLSLIALRKGAGTATVRQSTFSINNVTGSIIDTHPSSSRPLAIISTFAVSETTFLVRNCNITLRSSTSPTSLLQTVSGNTYLALAAVVTDSTFVFEGPSATIMVFTSATVSNSYLFPVQRNVSYSLIATAASGTTGILNATSTKLENTVIGCGNAATVLGRSYHPELFSAIGTESLGVLRAAPSVVNAKAESSGAINTAIAFDDSPIDHTSLITIEALRYNLTHIGAAISQRVSFLAAVDAAMNATVNIVNASVSLLTTTRTVDMLIFAPKSNTYVRPFTVTIESFASLLQGGGSAIGMRISGLGYLGNGATISMRDSRFSVIAGLTASLIIAPVAVTNATIVLEQGNVSLSCGADPTFSTALLITSQPAANLTMTVSDVSVDASGQCRHQLVRAMTGASTVEDSQFTFNRLRWVSATGAGATGTAAGGFFAEDAVVVQRSNFTFNATSIDVKTSGSFTTLRLTSTRRIGLSITGSSNISVQAVEDAVLFSASSSEVSADRVLIQDSTVLLASTTNVYAIDLSQSDVLDATIRVVSSNVRLIGVDTGNDVAVMMIRTVSFTRSLVEISSGSSIETRSLNQGESVSGIMALSGTSTTLTITLSDSKFASRAQSAAAYFVYFEASTTTSLSLLVSNCTVALLSESDLARVITFNYGSLISSAVTVAGSQLTAVGDADATMLFTTNCDIEGSSVAVSSCNVSVEARNVAAAFSIESGSVTGSSFNVSGSTILTNHTGTTAAAVRLQATSLRASNFTIGAGSVLARRESPPSRRNATAAITGTHVEVLNSQFKDASSFVVDGAHMTTLGPREATVTMVAIHVNSVTLIGNSAVIVRRATIECETGPTRSTGIFITQVVAEGVSSVVVEGSRLALKSTSNNVVGITLRSSTFHQSTIAVADTVFDGTSASFTPFGIHVLNTTLNGDTAVSLTRLRMRFSSSAGFSGVLMSDMSLIRGSVTLNSSTFECVATSGITTIVNFRSSSVSKHSFIAVRNISGALTVFGAGNALVTSAFNTVAGDSFSAPYLLLADSSNLTMRAASIVGTQACTILRSDSDLVGLRRISVANVSATLIGVTVTVVRVDSSRTMDVAFELLGSAFTGLDISNSYMALYINASLVRSATTIRDTAFTHNSSTNFGSMLRMMDSEVELSSAELDRSSFIRVVPVGGQMYMFDTQNTSFTNFSLVIRGSTISPIRAVARFAHTVDDLRRIVDALTFDVSGVDAVNNHNPVALIAEVSAGAIVQNSSFVIKDSRFTGFTRGVSASTGVTTNVNITTHCTLFNTMLITRAALQRSGVGHIALLSRRFDNPSILCRTETASLPPTATRTSSSSSSQSTSVSASFGTESASFGTPTSSGGTNSDTSTPSNSPTVTRPPTLSSTFSTSHSESASKTQPSTPSQPAAVTPTDSNTRTVITRRPPLLSSATETTGYDAMSKTRTLAVARQQPSTQTATSTLPRPPPTTLAPTTLAPTEQPTTPAPTSAVPVIDRCTFESLSLGVAPTAVPIRQFRDNGLRVTIVMRIVNQTAASSNNGSSAVAEALWSFRDPGTSNGTLPDDHVTVSWGAVAASSTRFDALNGTLTFDVVSTVAADVLPLRSDTTIVVSMRWNASHLRCTANESWTGDPRRLSTQSFVLQKLPEEIPQTVTKAVESMTVAATTVSAALSTPTTAMQQGRVNAIMTISQCEFSHSEAVSVLDSPLGMRVGSETGYWYRGGVIGNFILFAAMLVVSAFLVFLNVVPNGHRRHWRSIWGGMARLHLPGFLCVPVLVLLQGTVSMSTSLFMHGQSSVDAPIAAVTFMCVAAMTFGIAWITTRGFRAKVVQREIVDKARTPLRRFLFVIFLSRQKWVDDPAKPRSKNFKRHYQEIFYNYRGGMQAFLLVEVVVTIVVGALDGLKHPQYCKSTVVVLMTMLVGQALFAIVLRPFLAPMETFFHISISLVTVISAMLAMSSLYVDDAGSTGDRLQAATAAAGLLADVLSTTKLLFDVAMLSRWFISSYNRVLRKRRLIHEEKKRARREAKAKAVAPPPNGLQVSETHDIDDDEGGAAASSGTLIPDDAGAPIGGEGQGNLSKPHNAGDDNNDEDDFADADDDKGLLVQLINCIEDMKTRFRERGVDKKGGLDAGLLDGDAENDRRGHNISGSDDSDFDSDGRVDAASFVEEDAGAATDDTAVLVVPPPQAAAVATKGAAVAADRKAYTLEDIDLDFDLCETAASDPKQPRSDAIEGGSGLGGGGSALGRHQPIGPLYEGTAEERAEEEARRALQEEVVQMLRAASSKPKSQHQLHDEIDLLHEGSFDNETALDLL